MTQVSAIFFDLQGTLEGDGLGDITSFEFFPYAPAALQRLNEAGILTIVVTNQSRIGKRVITQEAFDERVATLTAELARLGARWDRVYCCPHTRRDQCQCRKPERGLIDRALKDFPIDIGTSCVVGDNGSSDMHLARHIGSRAVLVKTGVGNRSLGKYRHLWAEINADHIAEDVSTAVDWILDHR